MTDTDHLAALQLDVDMRLRDAWMYAFEAEECCEWDLELVGHLMRMAYGCGYIDALVESVPAQLHRDHGYKPPARMTSG